MRLLDRLFGGLASTGADGFRVAADHPLRAEHELLRAMMLARADSPDGRGPIDVSGLDPAAAVRMVRAAAERVDFWRSSHPRTYTGRDVYMHVVPPEVIQAVLRRRLSFSADQLAELLDVLRAHGLKRSHTLGLVRSAAAHRAPAGLPAPLRAALVRLRQSLDAPRRGVPSDVAKLALAIDDLLSERPGAVFDEGEPWIDGIVAVLESEQAADARPWTALCRHLLDADAIKSSGKWARETERLSAAIGDAFRARAPRRGSRPPATTSRMPSARATATFCVASCGASPAVGTPRPPVSWAMSQSR